MVPTNHLLGAAAVATSTKKSKNKSWQKEEKEMCGITYWHIYLMPSVFRKMNGGFQFNFGCANPPTACNLFKNGYFFKWLSLAVIRNIIYIIAVIFQAKLATTTTKINRWFEFLKCDYFPFPVLFSMIVNLIEFWTDKASRLNV